MPRTRSTQPESICQLKVTLSDIQPPVWRRLQVPANITFYKLHQILQVVMGWQNYHLYEFEVDGARYGESDPDFAPDTKNARRAKLDQLVREEGARLHYVYDFGDNWEHEILVEKLIPPEPGTRYPVCLTGERACPPEDCGGVFGYQEFLEAIRDPSHEQHEELLEWIGGGFDPEAFDLSEVNRGLRRIR